MNTPSLETKLAINEEVHALELEFSELSVVMRELLSRVYIRGAKDALEKIKAVIKST